MVHITWETTIEWERALTLHYALSRSSELWKHLSYRKFPLVRRTLQKWWSLLNSGLATLSPILHLTRIFTGSSLCGPSPVPMGTWISSSAWSNQNLIAQNLSASIFCLFHFLWSCYGSHVPGQGGIWHFPYTHCLVISFSFSLYRHLLCAAQLGWIHLLTWDAPLPVCPHQFVLESSLFETFIIRFAMLASYTCCSLEL